jgi:hypothetical protein
VVGGVTVAAGETLLGTPGVSKRWGSGWVDLNKAVDLKKGDRLRLKIGGTAKKILVRLLSDLDRADEPEGIVGDTRSVPANRLVEVVLDADYLSVKQISVHGNPRAWSWSLGGDNGPATLESVERVHP